MTTGRGFFPYGFLILTVFLIIGLLGCGEPQLERVQVTPEEKTLMVGESVSFNAVGFSSKGKEMPDLVFHWSIEGEAGSMDKSGRFTAEKPGQATIIATANGLTGHARITVKPRPITKTKTQPEVIPHPKSKEVSDQPDIVLIDNPDFKVRKKGPVKLEHRKHSEEYKIACTECHHDYQDGKNIWTKKDPVKKCVSCHDPGKKQGDVIKLQNAYHKNCKTCHKKLVKEKRSKTSPFKKCSGCHQKKS